MSSDLGKLVKSLHNLKQNETVTIRRVGQNYVIDNKDTSPPFVDLILTACDSDHGIIPVNNKTRKFFPGYRKQFILETSFKPFVMHLTGGDGTSASVGRKDIGGYLGHPRATEIDPALARSCPDSTHHIEGSFKRFYEIHPELVEGSIVRIERISSKKYRILELISD